MPERPTIYCSTCGAPLDGTGLHALFIGRTAIRVPDGRPAMVCGPCRRLYRDAPLFVVLRVIAERDDAFRRYAERYLAPFAPDCRPLADPVAASIAAQVGEVAESMRIRAL